MTSTFRTVISLSQVALTTGLALLPVDAIARPVPSIESNWIAAAKILPQSIAVNYTRGNWKGQGKIVQGNGQGGVVQLALTFDGRKVWTTQGPSFNRATRKLDGFTARDQDRVWRFQRCGQGLCISLEHPRQVVRYVLYRQ